jgi:hypothetical protein
LTIKFICSCGKHLRARDDMAARRSVCPRCGSPVGIPSLKPTLPGGAPPLSPQERLRHARTQKPPPGAAPAPRAEAPPAAPAPVETRVVRLLSTRAQRPARTGQHLEKRWYECLAYPFRAARLCLGLALFLTVLSAVGAVEVPVLLDEPPAEPWALALFRLSWVLFLVVIVGVPCSFLDRVLASASAGEVYYILWSGNPPLTVLVSGARWLACFLAGPVVFAAAGWLYWLQCGDPGLVGWLILAELGVVAVTYQAFALAAVADRGRLRDLNPVAVVDLAHRLGWRALVAVPAGALLLLAHGWLLLAGVEEVHTTPLLGLVMLAGGWGSGVFWSTFFCRLLGVWCFRSRPALPAEAQEGERLPGEPRRGTA